MNLIPGTKAQNIEKFPGCLGRMVNMFDLNTGVPGNRLLNDKPHYHGSSLSRSHSDVVRMMSPSFVDPIEDKLVVSEVRRTSSDQKTNGTPMKTLLAQEMSKEVESKHNPPNVVAKLMGLDTLPRHLPNLAAQRSHPRGFSRRSLSHSEMPTKCWEQDEGFLEKQMQHDFHHCQELNKCKDVYEIWQRSEKTNYASVRSPQEKYIDAGNEKKMALVRQKFMEAKRLSTDEKLRQSKEFQDALEVLSVNKELFLQFLQEPNSMFSQHLHNLQSLPPPPETKRITVLRPSNMVENDKFRPTGKKVDKQIKKPAQVGQVIGWDRSNPAPFDNQNANEHPAQPTRIVVLRPSPGKPQGTKVAPPPSSLSVFSGVEDFFEEPEDDAEESSEVAKEITRQMRENIIGHRRDETMLSSVFSNGYIGDDSSFNKSENEYAAGNFSDSEVTSPASRHSWDYINRFASPYSSSSFCRASCSPESSVCREAKKRLSERWAMMASNGKSEELRHVRRSSSTLGEMLALSDTKKPARSDEEGKEQQPRGSTSCIVSNEESTSGSPKNLLRSKSVPVSSTAFGAILNVEVSNLDGGKMQAPKEVTKAKSKKSSLKGKVSSLFFSKSKKKEKSNGSQLEDDSSSATPGMPGSPVVQLQNSNRISQCINDCSFEECSSPGLGRSSTPDSTSMEKGGMISQEASLLIAKPFMPDHVIENQDQPSPVSVLEPPFEEDEATKLESSSNLKLDHGGARVLPKSNLIDKSPPIGSIARTLSWDDSCVETGTKYPLKPSGSSGSTEEEDNWPCFVQSILSAAGVDHEARLDSFSARCHSPQSPLDPSLRDKYANLNETEPVHESKRRQRRSNRKLAFDCVNAALVDITSYGFDKGTIPSPTLVDHMWAQMKDWFSSDVVGTTGDDGDTNNSLFVEKVIRKEVVGNGWADQTKLEIDNLGKEIERKLLEELVEDAVMDLTGRAIS